LLHGTWPAWIRPPDIVNRVPLNSRSSGTSPLSRPAKYFHSLDDGEVPLLLLFSGTVFLKSADGQGFSVEQVPWHKEARYRLPVKAWRELMDLYFPNSAWIRVRRETLDALQSFKSQRALPTWDDALEVLIHEAHSP